MMRPMRLWLAVAAIGLAAPTLASQAIAASVEGLARASDAVVRGRVGGARVLRSPDGRRLFTEYEVRPSAVLKGAAPPVVRVVVPGGVDGRLAQRVEGAPGLAAREDVVLFLRRSTVDAFGVTGLAQGKFTVSGALATPELSQVAFVGASVGPGERRVEQMPLAELERRVRSVR